MSPTDSPGGRSRHLLLPLATAAALIALAPTPAQAYIGPGAGFALLSSFLVLFSTIVLVFLSMLVWPFRQAWRLFRYRNVPKPWIRRLIIVGFDGQDPQITDRLMAQGKLPNLKALAETGCYHSLATTCPSVSPVAWSSFATGTNPGKHNVFDFLDRDRKTYLPLLSSTEIGSVDRFLKLGRFRIPLHKPTLRLLRKSKPFWTVLGEYRNWSTVLRVPITFPPEKFYGAQLSAMCAPDLLGTQGSFLYYTTRPEEMKFKEGGIRVQLGRNGDRFETVIEGPENAFVEGNPSLKIPMTIDVDRAGKKVRVRVGNERLELEPHKLSDWVTLVFKAAPGMKVQGICRMQVLEMDEHFSMYVTPLNIDPEKPAMPISHPSYYATYLAKRIGHFCTLGLAEDTWALNEGITDDATFLQQSYDIDQERQDMFFASLDQLRKGTLICVFDATDRIQHMFWRYTEKGHPAARGIENPEHTDAIERIYTHNDGIVGKVRQRVREGDVLMVISDHGFTSFRRGVNLNRWLLDNGYLFLQEGAKGDDEWLQHVDWSRTKAYVLGLSGMFLNLAGREAHGIVQPGEEAQALKDELIAKLNGFRDEERGAVAITEMFDTAKIYIGPYTQNAPDLIIGYNTGYRTSWDAATGVVAAPVFEDNVKAWSGDHIVDPRLVPGVMFCNYPIERENPDIIDIAPTALQLFGLKAPGYMEGTTLFGTNVFGKNGSRSARGDGARPTTPIETGEDEREPVKEGVS